MHTTQHNTRHKHSVHTTQRKTQAFGAHNARQDTSIRCTRQYHTQHSGAGGGESFTQAHHHSVRINASFDRCTRTHSKMYTPSYRLAARSLQFWIRRALRDCNTRAARKTCHADVYEHMAHKHRASAPLLVSTCKFSASSYQVVLVRCTKSSLSSAPVPTCTIAHCVFTFAAAPS